jgi:hypothetical protein
MRDLQELWILPHFLNHGNFGDDHLRNSGRQRFVCSKDSRLELSDREVIACFKQDIATELLTKHSGGFAGWGLIYEAQMM